MGLSSIIKPYFIVTITEKTTINPETKNTDQLSQDHNLIDKIPQWSMKYERTD